jgi:hypothetical protein
LVSLADAANGRPNLERTHASNGVEDGQDPALTA